MNRIYLDNNASTPVDPAVCKVMLQVLQENVGNPSSIHSFGRQSKTILTNSRDTIANYLRVKPNEIIFTSCGTEGANLLIRGLCSYFSTGHIITSAVEHACVYTTLQLMQSKGWTVSFLQPGLWGAVTPEAIKEAIRPDTKFISLMAVNNETGVKTDIEAIGQIAQEANIPLIVDGVAWLGKEPITIPAGVSALFFSGHKVHAPKGVGFMHVKSNLKLDCVMSGGEQEYLRRGGTENLPGVAGLGEAVRLLHTELPEGTFRMQQLRDLLETELIRTIPGVTVNGEGPRICNTTNLAFDGVDGEAFMTALDMRGIAISHGSACSSGALEPSRVLLNMGIPRTKARSSIRFSLSRFTTENEIWGCIKAIQSCFKLNLPPKS